MHDATNSNHYKQNESFNMTSFHNRIDPIIRNKYNDFEVEAYYCYLQFAALLRHISKLLILCTYINLL